jgi:hypothetical protein
MSSHLILLATTHEKNDRPRCDVLKLHREAV